MGTLSVILSLINPVMTRLKLKKNNSRWKHCVCRNTMQARIYMGVFSTLMSWSNENKSCMRVDEAWQARVCVRVGSKRAEKQKFEWKFSQFMSQVKVCMRVFSILISWSNENKSCMRVKKRKFEWKSSYERSWKFAYLLVTTPSAPLSKCNLTSYVHLQDIITPSPFGAYLYFLAQGHS